jgi:hypothetical protein
MGFPVKSSSIAQVCLRSTAATSHREAILRISSQLKFGPCSEALPSLRVERRGSASIAGRASGERRPPGLAFYLRSSQVASGRKQRLRHCTRPGGHCLLVKIERVKGGFFVTDSVPIGVLTVVPTGSGLVGRVLPLAAVHSPVADGQYTQPLALQMSISPLSFTDHAQRAPFAVLSMQIPTAFLPSIARAGVDSVAAIMTKVAARINAACRNVL